MFTPQTKRFALVPVEPGNEKPSDVLVEQDAQGNCSLGFAHDWSSALALDAESYPQDKLIIAALGFPTEEAAA